MYRARPLAVLLTISLATALLPGAEAATYRYVGTGFDLGCHDDPLTGADTVCAGRIAFAAEPLTYLSIGPQDLAWDENVGYWVCFDDGGDTCISSYHGCGPSTTVVPVEANHVVIRFLPLLVDDVLHVCGATTGTLTI